MAVVGKYTWLSVRPDSYSTWPSGMSTHSSIGNQRCASASGKAASKWLARGGELGGIEAPRGKRGRGARGTALRSMGRL